MQTTVKTLTLRGGQSYVYDDLRFQQGKAVPVESYEAYVGLTRTGIFQEDPPLCCYYIRSKSGPRTVKIDDTWINVKTTPTSVPRYFAEKLLATGSVEKIEPLTIIDDYVASGKDTLRLLVLRDTNLGDVIMTTDVLWHLKDRYPKCNLTFATLPQFVPVVDNLPFIDKVVELGSVDPQDYDVSVNLCGWTERMPDCSQRERLDIIGEAFSGKFPWKKHRLHLILPEDEKVFVRNLDRRYNPSGLPYVVVTPFGSRAFRSIHPSSIPVIVEHLLDRGYAVYVVGATGSRPGLNLSSLQDIDGAVILWDQLSVRQFIALTALATAAICPDTATQHIAAAFDVPCVAVHTTVHEGVRTTYYPRVYPVGLSVNCRPCWNRPCVMTFDAPCVRDLAPSAITDTFDNYEFRGFPAIVKQPLALPKTKV